MVELSVGHESRIPCRAARRMQTDGVRCRNSNARYGGCPGTRSFWHGCVVRFDDPRELRAVWMGSFIAIRSVSARALRWTRSNALGNVSRLPDAEQAAPRCVFGEGFQHSLSSPCRRRMLRHVSGFTISSTVRQRDQVRQSPTQKSRSGEVGRTQPRWDLWRTVSWCRRARISICSGASAKRRPGCGTGGMKH